MPCYNPMDGHVSDVPFIYSCFKSDSEIFIIIIIMMMAEMAVILCGLATLNQGDIYMVIIYCFTIDLVEKILPVACNVTAGIRTSDLPRSYPLGPRDGELT